MSVNLSIKNVPDALADKLRQRAEANHRSLQGELMALLERALSDNGVEQVRVNYAVPDNAAKDAVADEKSLQGSVARISQARAVDTVRLIREMREERTDHLMRLIERDGAAARARQLLGLPPRESAGAGSSALTDERKAPVRRKATASAKR